MLYNPRGVARCSRSRPEDALPSAGGGGRTLEYTPAQAVQMRPLYEIAGGESGAAAALAQISAQLRRERPRRQRLRALATSSSLLT